MLLNSRAQHILRAVVTTYIKLADPVGSRTVTKQYGVGLSPATVRNTMADLVEMGYLTQPHTSAGRIPTERAFRFYVDQLMGEGEFGPEPAEDEIHLRHTDDLRGLLQETSRALSLLSRYTGMVLAPTIEQARIRHFEFVQVRRSHLLAIFVSDDGEVHSRAVETEEEFTQAQLDRMGAYLNEAFRGLSLGEVKRRLLEEMRADKTLYDRLLRTAMELGMKAVVSPQEESEVYLGGTTSLFDIPDLAAAETMKALFAAFEERHAILRLLEQCSTAEGVRVLIGSENAFLGLPDCSVVVSNYRRGDQVLGTLGIIGPMRMEYERVIPLVRHTARLLGRVLEGLEAA